MEPTLGLCFSLFGFGSGFLACLSLLSKDYYFIAKSEWKCTQSRVVKEAMPREEECIQYTRKEGK